ncbi:MAG: hypothetical protein ACRD0U_21275 [Acidimicrobiales bacterium]
MKWRVDARDKTRAFKTRAEAERLRARLQMAVIDGEGFDLATGLPMSWVDREATWWSWSQQWLAIKWSQWAGHTRRSAVESLVALTPVMKRPGAPPASTDVIDWLRVHGSRPGSAGWEPPPDWLGRWSVPLLDVDPALLESVRTRATTKLDGSPVSTEVARRRKTHLNSILRAAVRRGLLELNPMDRTEWKPPARTIAVEISTVPSYSDVLAISDYVAALRTDGARYAALFATVGIAGMRPSEAIGVQAADLDMPAKGWGLAVLRGAVTSPGTRYTRTGQVVEGKELKQRSVETVREVRVAPELMDRLRRHRRRFPPVDGSIFSNGGGRAPTTTNYGPVWGRARAVLWPPGHHLAGTTVYDLRHSGATVMLRAGVPPPR